MSETVIDGDVAVSELDRLALDEIVKDEAVDVALETLGLALLSDDTAEKELCVCVELAVTELEKLPPLDLPLHTFL